MSYYEKEFEKLNKKYDTRATAKSITTKHSEDEGAKDNDSNRGDQVYVGRGEDCSPKFPRAIPPFLNRKSIRNTPQNLLLDYYIGSSGESEYCTPKGSLTPGNPPESAKPKQLCKAKKANEQSKKKLRTQKALGCILYAALKYQSEKLNDLESYIAHKRKEFATRQIQQVIILSSYRKTREHLTQLSQEKEQLHLKLESINLQYQVAKHMQHNEQEKHFDLSRKIESLEIELSHLKRVLSQTNETYNEYQEVRDKTYTERKNLLEAQARLRMDLPMLTSKCDLIHGSIDLERKRYEKYVNDNRLIRNQLNTLCKELRDAHEKKDIWQEELRNKESENWELQLQSESKANQLMEIERSMSSIKSEILRILEENEDLALRNELLENSLQVHQNEVMIKQTVLVSTETNFKEQENTLVSLQEEANELTIENEALRTEINSYKLKNLRKRRQWIRLLALITTPFFVRFSPVYENKTSMTMNNDNFIQF